MEKSNGLRTAVKLGEITAQEALEWVQEQEYTSRYIVTWLKNRIRREK